MQLSTATGEAPNLALLPGHASASAVLLTSRPMLVEGRVEHEDNHAELPIVHLQRRRG